jgi:hypothetical protein
MRHATTALLLGALLVPTAFPARGGEADVVEARARCDAERRCHFAVAVRHADEGWEHYANRWEVLTPEGEVLGTRVLQHPHVKEQPFTRSLAGVAIPESVSRVRVRARDSEHGWGGLEVEVEIEVRPRPTDGEQSPPG